MRYDVCVCVFVNAVPIDTTSPEADMCADMCVPFLKSPRTPSELVDVAMERDDVADRGAGRTRADAARRAQWRLGCPTVLPVLRAHRFCSGAGQHAA